jgi:hypothetical protein
VANALFLLSWHADAQVGGTLEKLSTRERFLNEQFENLSQEYRLVRERLNTVQVSLQPHGSASLILVLWLGKYVLCRACCGLLHAPGPCKGFL